MCGTVDTDEVTDAREAKGHLTISNILAFSTDWAIVDGEGVHAHVLIHMFMVFICILGWVMG